MPTTEGANGPLGLRIVDGLRLPEPQRAALQPGALVRDAGGRLRRLPRFFYEVGSWEQARQTALTPHFGLYELMQTDVREAAAVRVWPRYVPCGVTALAAALELVRLEAGTYVHVAGNGGYRSPAHGADAGEPASVHHWGTAANLYRVGDDWLDAEAEIRRYADLVRSVLPFAFVRPYGPGPGQADDHLHVDLGYLTVVPADAPGDDTSNPET